MRPHYPNTQHCNNEWDNNIPLRIASLSTFSMHNVDCILHQAWKGGVYTSYFKEDSNTFVEAISLSVLKHVDR